MTNTITKERRDAVRAAALAATPSPWRSDRTGLYVWAASAKLKDDTFPLADGGGNDAVIARMRGWGYYTGKGGGALALSSDEAIVAIRRDLDHIANCDPQTILSLLDALDAAEARAAQADHAASCLADMVKELQAAAEAKMGESVAWLWRAKVSGEWGLWSAVEVDPSDWTWRGVWQELEVRPLYAAPPAAEPVIPEGWVLVPREPTEAMKDAVRQIADVQALAYGLAAWDTMLAAAPALVSEKEAE